MGIAKLRYSAHDPTATNTSKVLYVDKLQKFCFEINLICHALFGMSDYKEMARLHRKFKFYTCRGLHIFCIFMNCISQNIDYNFDIHTNQSQNFLIVPPANFQSSRKDGR